MNTTVCGKSSVSVLTTLTPALISTRSARSYRRGVEMKGKGEGSPTLRGMTRNPQSILSRTFWSSSLRMTTEQRALLHASTNPRNNTETKCKPSQISVDPTSSLTSA